MLSKLSDKGRHAKINGFNRLGLIGSSDVAEMTSETANKIFIAGSARRGSDFSRTRELAYVELRGRNRTCTKERCAPQTLHDEVKKVKVGSGRRAGV